MPTAADAPGAPTALRIGVAGAGGRMGRMLVEAVLAAPDLRLAGAIEAPASAGLGGDAAAFLGRHTGVLTTADAGAAIAGIDVLIDFTRPAATLAHLALAAERGVKCVIGTTGFDAAGQAAITRAAERTAVVFAANMSVGVNVMLTLLEAAARTLGDGYDVEVIEAHHRQKVDAPSGTALAMGEAIARALGRTLEADGVFTRHGHPGARSAREIGFSTVRGGDIVGEHTVLFAGTGERLEITHRSSSRVNYAEGSLRAARFLAGRDRGLHDMRHVLGLAPLPAGH
jgi:4-hydroxy-tetrahydrodipicolinate reductase